MTIIVPLSVTKSFCIMCYVIFFVTECYGVGNTWRSVYCHSGSWVKNTKTAVRLWHSSNAFTFSSGNICTKRDCGSVRSENQRTWRQNVIWSCKQSSSWGSSLLIFSVYLLYLSIWLWAAGVLLTVDELCNNAIAIFSSTFVDSYILATF